MTASLQDELHERRRTYALDLPLSWWHMASNKWLLTFSNGDITEYIIWSEDDEEDAWDMASYCCSELYERTNTKHDIIGFEEKYYFLVELYTKERYVRCINGRGFRPGTLA